MFLLRLFSLVLLYIRTVPKSQVFYSFSKKKKGGGGGGVSRERKKERKKKKEEDRDGTVFSWKVLSVHGSPGQFRV